MSPPPSFHSSLTEQEDSIVQRYLRKINHGAVNKWKTCASSIGFMWLPGCDPKGTMTKGIHSYPRMLWTNQAFSMPLVSSNLSCFPEPGHMRNHKAKLISGGQQLWCEHTLGRESDDEEEAVGSFSDRVLITRRADEPNVRFSCKSRRLILYGIYLWRSAFPLHKCHSDIQLHSYLPISAVK